jgi:hypothetical protein
MLSTKQNMYCPQNHLVLSIVLEFLAFIVTIYLNKAPLPIAFQPRPNTCYKVTMPFSMQ